MMDLTVQERYDALLRSMNTGDRYGVTRMTKSIRKVAQSVCVQEI
jgi:hypothetical protein